VTTQDSLSVVLTVCNGAQQLAERVSRLLELLPEITTRFEILILDNGSTDRSDEVAYDLARSFPQLRVVRHAERRPEQDLVRTGLQQTSGDLIIIYDERAPIRLNELRRMWELRHDQQLVIARPPGQHQNSLVERLAAWAARVQDKRVVETDQSGFQMIRRRALRELEQEPIEIRKAPVTSPPHTRTAPVSKA